MFTKNESQMDRAIRLVVGLVLLAIGYQLGGWLQIVLYVMAIIALITAATGTCWLYQAFGMNTAKHEAKTAASGETKTADAKSYGESREEPKTMPAVEPEISEKPVEETSPSAEAMEDKPEVVEEAKAETPEVTEETVEEVKLEEEAK